MLGVLVVLLAVALSVAGLVLSRSFVPLETRESHNVATGIVYAALYVIYGVALAFAMLLVWEQFEEARSNVEREAVAVERLYRLSETMPEPGGGRVQRLAAAYARTVAEEEWDSMDRGRAHPEASRLAFELGEAVRRQEPATDVQDALYAESLAKLDDVREGRALRLLEAREGLPTVLWVVLLVGAVTTVAFTYLFGMRNLLLHALAVGALALVLSLVLFTIGVLQHPFDGDVRVQQDAFEQVVEDIEGG